MVFNVKFDFHRTVKIDWIVKTECRDPGVFLINFDKDCSSFVIKRLRMIMVGIASFLASTFNRKKKNNGSQIQHIYCQFTLHIVIAKDKKLTHLSWMGTNDEEKIQSFLITSVHMYQR